MADTTQAGAAGADGTSGARAAGALGSAGTAGTSGAGQTRRKREVNEEKVRQSEIAISLVLRIGVSVAVALVMAGLGLTFARHPGYAHLSGSSYHPLTMLSSKFPHTIGQLGHALAIGDGRGLIGLGLVVLIATPVLRVAVAVLTFAYEKDPPMTIVTLFVLAVLLSSFFIGGA